MTDPELSDINLQLRAILEKCSALLGDESTGAVEHYLDHDEYEMALEGLIIDLLAAGRLPSDLKWSDLVALGYRLNLDKESTFDPSAWPRLLALAGKG